MKITRKQIRLMIQEANSPYEQNTYNPRPRYDNGTYAGDSSTLLSRNKNELRALSKAFSVQILPEDLQNIEYKQRKSKGTTWLQLEDLEEALGHITASIDEKFAAQFGTSVEQVLSVLINGGAAKATPTRRAPRGTSYYD